MMYKLNVYMFLDISIVRLFCKTEITCLHVYNYRFVSHADDIHPPVFPRFPCHPIPRNAKVP